MAPSGSFPTSQTRTLPEKSFASGEAAVGVSPSDTAASVKEPASWGVKLTQPSEAEEGTEAAEETRGGWTAGEPVLSARDAGDIVVSNRNKRHPGET